MQFVVWFIFNQFYTKFQSDQTVASQLLQNKQECSPKVLIEHQEHECQDREALPWLSSKLHPEGACLDQAWKCSSSASGGFLPGPSLEMQFFSIKKILAWTEPGNATSNSASKGACFDQAQKCSYSASGECGPWPSSKLQGQTLFSIRRVPAWTKPGNAVLQH